MTNIICAIEIFNDIVNFIVDKLPPDEVIAFRPSPRAQRRFDELSRAIQGGVAASGERAEMDDNWVLARRRHGVTYNRRINCDDCQSVLQRLTN